MPSPGETKLGRRRGLHLLSLELVPAIRLDLAAYEMDCSQCAV